MEERFCMKHDGLFYIVLGLSLLAISGYCIAVFHSNRRYQKWPVKRVFFWVFGIFLLTICANGPLASMAHTDFRIHMVVHLLLGMLAPLLLVLAAPVTLLLRTLKVQAARRLSRLLKSDYLKFVSHPIIASLLNIGGLWLLYKSNLFRLMHENAILHFLIHVHIFLAGYLFTASFLNIDPTPHRYSYRFRMIVFILATAAHGILSKSIYAAPPHGVSEHQAQISGMLMYYGGDFIDMFIIFILCYQWFQAASPDRRLAFNQ